MKKKIMGILICSMFLTIIPAAAGADNIFENTDDISSTGIIKDRIIMRGLVVNPHTSIGGSFVFFSLRVHYMAFGTQGLKTGIVHLRRLTLPETPTGIITNGFILISFKGQIEDIV